jgi:hypothetical protein
MPRAIFNFIPRRKRRGFNNAKGYNFTRGGKKENDK